MERKYTMIKPLAAVLISRIHEENLPIEVHEGNERIDCHGDRQVDVLLVYEDQSLLRRLIDDCINKTYDLD